MSLLVSPKEVRQPKLFVAPFQELHVAIASLSLGGAERIVLDWIQRIYPRWRVHLIVLRTREKEWSVPKHVRITRLEGVDICKKLISVGETIAFDKNPVCACHLLNTKERKSLSQCGATIVPVLHNARNGWIEGVESLNEVPYVVAVSKACEADLYEDGWNGTVSVIRHIPPVRKKLECLRTKVRKAWNIPENALLIGMVGAVKPQKNYIFALEIFAELLKRQDAYLVIVGGPVNTKVGLTTWKQVVEKVHKLGLRHRVAMPGFVPEADCLLSAFDVMLNSSNFEGLSIATLEALLAKVPVVASSVGGQGEIADDALKLIPIESKPQEWACELINAMHKKVTMPTWADFPSHRLWTLVGLTRPMKSSSKTLFVTANLSAGGAQRSLVNLTKSLQKINFDFEIMVAGKSSATYFYDKLQRANIKVMRASNRWDVFDFAEAIIAKVVSEGFGTICFWNTDARVKLLLTKAFEFGGLRFIDVSPGGHSFEEMRSFERFEQLIAFTNDQYLKRLDQLVLKYHTEPPISGCIKKTAVIQNGIPFEESFKHNYTLVNRPRIVVSGRISPTKFLLEIIFAMRTLWKSMPHAELHIIGAAEHYHDDYYYKLLEEVGVEKDIRIFFHGQRFDVIKELPEFDAYVVLGIHQGCPNALLEAMMAGLPVVGNDDGGTREQIIDEVTGLLIPEPKPILLAQALKRLLSNRELAKNLGIKAREYVCRNFTMSAMVNSYLDLFTCKE